MKLVKARKNHICSNCGDVIYRHSHYLYMTYRDPVYDDDIYPSKQVGIKYVHYKLCLKCDADLQLPY